MKIVTLLTILLVSTTAWAQAPTIETTAAAYVDVVPKAFGVAPFSGYVIAAKNGKVVFSKGFSKEALVPTDVDHFAIGSVTKHVVALEILALEKQGLLKRSDPIKKYFHHLPEWSQSVTIEQLANHTAGFANYTANPDFQKVKNDVLGLSDILTLASISKPAHPPGKKWAYSNTHYYLLGVVIEKVTSEKYITRIQKDLFSLAGVSKVDSYKNRKTVQGYSSTQDPKDPTARILEAVALPSSTGPSAAGELSMNAKEAIDWAIFVANLNEDILAKFTKGSQQRPSYGMGIFTDAKSTWINHGGGIDGFQTYFAVDPKTKSAVVVLGNCVGCGVSEIGDWMKSWIHDGKIPEIPAPLVTVNPILQKEIAGSYALDTASQKKLATMSKAALEMVKAVKIYSKNGNLMFDLIGQPEFAIKSRKGLLVGPSSISITDIKKKKGKVTEFLMNQGALKIRYVKQ